MDDRVRRADERDLPLLAGIERTGDKMFADQGINFPPGPMVIEAMVAYGAEILVAGDPPIGFAGIIALDDHPHLEQISVHADHGRRGIGTRLLTEVIDREGPGLTLITFRDVPWNAPWYAKHGFTEWPEAEWGPALTRHWRTEIAAGLHAQGPRLVMRHP